MKYSQLITQIKSISTANETKRITICIDGRCGSGKTTLATQLSKSLNAPVIHMDDFFLPLELRTPERLCEIGGNFHYERFSKEVLPFLKLNKDFLYRKFDCSTMSLGEICLIENSKYIIVEGSYSQHPKLYNYSDIKLFLTIDETEQIKRITARNGEAKAEMFKNRWIPLEEKYFSAYKIENHADVLLSMPLD